MKLTKETKDKLVLHYTFNAPKQLVFEAFSSAEALNQWWGPAEAQNSVISLDFRPGGIFHFRMDFEGNVSYGRFHYLRIEPFELLEFNNAFADEHANVIPPPFDASFPLEVRYTITFTEENRTTKMKLVGEPVDANATQRESFKALFESMEQGFGATFEQLGRYIKSFS